MALIERVFATDLPFNPALALRDLLTFCRVWQHPTRVDKQGNPCLSCLYICPDDDVSRAVDRYILAPTTANLEACVRSIGDVLEVMVLADTFKAAGGLADFVEYRKYLRVRRMMMGGGVEGW